MYRTSSLDLSAAIRTILGSSPTVQIQGRLAEFIFQVDTQEAQRLAEHYYADNLSANLRAFATNLRDLKALIHQARETQGR